MKSDMELGYLLAAILLAVLAALLTGEYWKLDCKRAAISKGYPATEIMAICGR